MKPLIAATLSLLLLASPCLARGVHYDIVGHREDAASRRELAAPAVPADSSGNLINFNIGTPQPSATDAQYPQTRNNIRPTLQDNGSVVPAIKRYICTGPGCTCGNGPKP